MPRQARIDAPGAMHHIIIRGIEKKSIFQDDKDRRDFLERLSSLLQETFTPCYAWALMPNHAHLLLRTGSVPIATIMRRLLTGYAVRYNKRHERCGHLFQNRYKSILCEQNRYLEQLVAYIHLNPVRSGIVEDITALTVYPFTGQSALMGKESRPWQDTKYVLSLFGKSVSVARKNLQKHLIEWSARKTGPELAGGGLIRSAGGWRAVKAAYRNGIRISSDERILGSSEFVEATLKLAGEAYDRRMRLQSSGLNLSGVIMAACSYFKIDLKELTSRTKRLEIARARAVIGHIATQELSISGSEVAFSLHVDRSAVSRAVQKVRKDPDLLAVSRNILELLGS